jgi:hypothetical protein
VVGDFQDGQSVEPYCVHFFIFIFVVATHRRFRKRFFWITWLWLLGKIEDGALVDLERGLQI